jgi:hypothetical protein
MISRQTAAVYCAVLLTAWLMPCEATAQNLDHTKCRRIVAGEKIKAKVDVVALDERFGADKCKLRRARLLCEAVERTGIEPAPELAAIAGDSLAGDFVCYQAKCKSRPDANTATDAFGSRRIGRLTAKLLCLPAT